MKGSSICHLLIRSLVATICSSYLLSSTRYASAYCLSYGRRTRVMDITMRKQKASDRRTRRMQQGDISQSTSSFVASSSSNQSPSDSKSLVRSPYETVGEWKHKRVSFNADTVGRDKKKKSGRGRSQKRSYTYLALSSYHSLFYRLLEDEFRAEESEVLSRIELSAHNPLQLEDAGYSLFDMIPERRGNIFNEEVYRLMKPKNFISASYSTNSKDRGRIPKQSQFSLNDVIILTKQPRGEGDIFSTSSSPLSREAQTKEARVIGTGPTYVDIAMPSGAFEQAFGPAPNNKHGKKGDPAMRLRVDRFFSAIPYNRMCTAISQITSLPSSQDGGKKISSIDPCLREVIVSTYGNGDKSYPAPDADLQALAKKLAQSPFKSSARLATEVLTFIRSNPRNVFPPYNEPQMTAIGAALSRRFTMIQGPPGTGKTTVAAAIGFGFVHQARSLSSNARVLACAFSNVGADQLARSHIKLGLKVIRVGNPSSVSEDLRSITLESAISQDPDVQQAQDAATKATSLLTGNQSSSTARNAATAAVNALKAARKIAATTALRSSDVVVSTSIGAADSHILSACGIITAEEEEEERNLSMTTKSSKEKGTNRIMKRDTAPDGGPSLQFPFTIIDESCQSVEPAVLVPLISTDSCRALVLLGDPCQLPPTVKTDPSGAGLLSAPLMSRLATILPSPVIVTAKSDTTDCDNSILDCKATRRAKSNVLRNKIGNSAYRKKFSGSLLLSVQYRMHPSIAAFSSSIYYDGLLKTPSILSNYRSFPQSLNDQYALNGKPLTNVRFINVGGNDNEKRDEGSNRYNAQIEERRSFVNELEAIEVIKVIEALLSEYSTKRSIGVISPYSSQVLHIKKLLSEQNLSEDERSFVEVNTVDGYQGRERDIIILSTVRSNRQNKVGFLADWRRMNVAITRSKCALIVVGDIDTLSKGNLHWNAFSNWCQDTGCVVDADKNNAC